jgi:glycosyltransferase involved in cell wall biosynthesis
MQHLLTLLERIDEFDLVHDHSGMLGLLAFGLARAQVLHTVHGPLTGDAGRMYASLGEVVPDAGLVSLTLNQRRPMPQLNWVANVHNAVDLSRYPCRRAPEDYLLFLGRMSPAKGAHHAITVARRVGRPLVIAAKCREPGEMAYFERHVAPHLGDDVVYVGEAGHAEKCRLLQRAHALLVPIEWEEPFGLVMIEALACGTPVVALRRGSVPELLRHGRTGLVADDLDGMVEALRDAPSLEPDVLRREAERRFAPQRMVERYLAAYEDMLDVLPARRTAA